MGQFPSSNDFETALDQFQKMLKLPFILELKNTF